MSKNAPPTIISKLVSLETLKDLQKKVERADKLIKKIRDNAYSAEKVLSILEQISGCFESYEPVFSLVGDTIEFINKPATTTASWLGKDWTIGLNEKTTSPILSLILNVKKISKLAVDNKVSRNSKKFKELAGEIGNMAAKLQTLTGETRKFANSMVDIKEQPKRSKELSSLKSNLITDEIAGGIVTVNLVPTNEYKNIITKLEKPLTTNNSWLFHKDNNEKVTFVDSIIQESDSLDSGIEKEAQKESTLAIPKFSLIQEFAKNTFEKLKNRENNTIDFNPKCQMPGEFNFYDNFAENGESEYELVEENQDEEWEDWGDIEEKLKEAPSGIVSEIMNIVKDKILRSSKDIDKFQSKLSLLVKALEKADELKKNISKENSLAKKCFGDTTINNIEKSKLSKAIKNVTPWAATARKWLGKINSKLIKLCDIIDKKMELSKLEQEYSNLNDINLNYSNKNTVNSLNYKENADTVIISQQAVTMEHHIPNNFIARFWKN